MSLGRTDEDGTNSQQFGKYSGLKNGKKKGGDKKEKKKRQEQGKKGKNNDH